MRSRTRAFRARQGVDEHNVATAADPLIHDTARDSTRSPRSRSCHLLATIPNAEQGPSRTQRICRSGVEADECFAGRPLRLFNHWYRRWTRVPILGCGEEGGHCLPSNRITQRVGGGSVLTAPTDTDCAIGRSPGRWLDDTRRLVIHPALFARDLLAPQASAEAPTALEQDKLTSSATLHRSPASPPARGRKQAHAVAHTHGALSTVGEDEDDCIQKSADAGRLTDNEDAHQDTAIRREMEEVAFLIDRFADVDSEVAGLTSLSLATPYGLTNDVWRVRLLARLSHPSC